MSQDLFRAYEIILDSTNVGIIFAGQTICVPVVAGTHSLKMSIDWCGSEEINFSIASGEEITFECSGFSIFQVLLIPYYLIFRPNNWILLKRLG
ncbi:MAG: hypothetical protein RM022_012770 [Nostoc sp. EfeVER01]|uniref:hypothetical protein n=1 Tax=Nostoc sp. EfeVER01 TaxID=3075406 RepID=UPI002AD21D08|nr:hypothetical protein [Nostoc sp. EfeVER01]MDZ7946282.1 hypothetical protein [Nostoc sp. EfeVER01]